MNGLMVSISHPDFVENDDDQRAGFIDGFCRGWARTKEAQRLTIGDPIVREDEGAGSVLVYFAYGAEGTEVREAEIAAAALMMTVCYYVVHHNRGPSSETLPTYSFSISRNVAVPLSAQDASAEPVIEA